MNTPTIKTTKKVVFPLAALLSIASLSAQDIARPQPAQVSGARADYSQILSQPVDKSDFAGEEVDTSKAQEAADAVSGDGAGSMSEAKVPEVDNRTVFILDVDITGATAFSLAKLKSLVADKMRAELTFAEIQGLAETIQDFYAANAMPEVSVIIPTGALKGTTLTIAVFETAEEESVYAKAQARDAEPKVYILDLNIEGSQVYSPAQLKHLVAHKLRKDFTFKEIEALANEIQSYYRENGYPVVRVIIPKAGLQGTVLTLKVLEGKLGTVKVVGNERVSGEMVRDTLYSYVEDGRAFNVQDLETALTRLNNLSGISVSSYLEAGMEDGTTDINVQVQEDNRISGSIEINNFGSENSGEYRVIPYLSFKNLTGIGDELSAYAAIAADEPESWSYQVAYKAPIGTLGTSLSGYFGQGNNTVGNEYAILDIDGDSTSWGFGLSHKFVWGAKRSLVLEAMFDWLDYNQTVGADDYIDDKVRKVRIGATFDNADSVGRTIVSLYLHQGLGEAIGAMDDIDNLSSRYNANNDFTKMVLSAVRVQSLIDRVYSIINFTGQYSFDPLLASEQVYLGGANSVRGQPYSSMYGDSAILINAEVRYTLLTGATNLQLATFIDYGLVYSEEGYANGDNTMDMAGAGLGIRAGLFGAFDLRVDVAFPVGDRYGDDFYLYGQLRYGF